MRKQLRRLLLFTGITAAAAFGSQSAFAGHGSPDGGPKAGCEQQQKHKGHRGFFRKMAKELGLSDQQKSEAGAIFKEGQAKHKPLFEAMRSERQQMQTLVHSGTADEAAIRAQAAKVAKLQADLAVQRAEQFKHFLALLTPEQAAKLKELQSKRRGNFDEFPFSQERMGK